MKKILAIAISVVCISAYALPTYEPFTEYASHVTAGGGSYDLANSGAYVTNGPVVEQWGGGSSGFGLMFKQTGRDVILTNNPNSVFTAANMSNILPSGFPGAGSDIYISAYLPTNSGANTAGNCAVLKFAQDIPRPTNGLTTIYVSYLLSCTDQGKSVGAGNVGRYAGFLSQTNISEGSGSAGAYATWASLFNTFSATGPNYVSFGQKINSPAITGGGNDILAADSSGANSPSSGNAGVGVNYNTANFVVGCFTFSSSMNDSNAVWVNPPTSDFGGANPSSTNFNSFKMTTMMSDVGAFFLESRSGSSSGGISTSFLGNLLIGTTWSYVTGGPEFTNQPVNFTVLSNAPTAVFTGDAVAAAQSVNYHWQHVVGGLTNDLTDGVGTAGGSATVSGSTTDRLTLAGVNAGDKAGVYQLKATAGGTGFSLISQTAAIIGDPNIVSSPSSAAVNYGGSANFTAAVQSIEPTMSYQWYFGSIPLLDGLQADGSMVNGASGTVSDHTVSTTLSLSNVTFGENGNYSLWVTNNFNNAVQSSAAVLAVNATAPIIISQLPLAHTNQLNLLVGASPTFSITADGATPIYYQWFSNNVTINGATNSSFTLTDAQPGNSGAYYCLASNFVGGTFSSTNNVSVLTTAAPYPQSVMALNPADYWRLNEGPDDGNGNQYATCFDYAGCHNGLYTNVYLAEPGYNAITDPSETSAQFGWAYYSPNSYVGQMSGIDFSMPLGGNAAFTVEAWENGYPESADAAIVSKENYGNGGEQFVLDVHSGVYRFFVRDASGTAHAVSSAVSPDNTWHHLAGVCDEANGVVALYVDGQLAGSGFITPGSGIFGATNLTIGSRMSGVDTAYNDQLHGNVNDVAVYSSALSASQIAAQYFSAGVSPVFTQSPAQNVTVNQNGTLTVPAGAAGTDPLAYQWYDYNTGLPLAAQTNATLVVGNIQNSDNFYLTVTNQYGATNSQIVSVTVISGAPVITRDLPPAVTTRAGRSYTFAVEVQGTEPISYTWYKDLNLIAGQSGPSYTFDAQSGNYSVAASNVYGGTVSTISTMSAVSNPTNSYAANILELNPVGYWPLQETSAPATANLETNYGSLGVLGTAYYAGTNATGVIFGQGGALTATGDNDSSVGFPGGNTSSYLFVPLKSSGLYLKPPFTFECWVNSTSTALGDLMGDAGANGDGSGTWSGIRMSYNGAFSGGPTLTAYTYAPGSNANGYKQVNAAAFSLSAGVWNYCVMTYDGNNLQLFVNGVLQTNVTAAMATNYWSPLTFGTGRWDKGTTRGYTGLLDEAAIYTNVLSSDQISNHYLAAITSGSNYVQAILSDNPLLYYRMDNVYTNPSPATYPTAVNYGSAPVDAAYEPGIVPGGVIGPEVLGNSAMAAPINGVYSCVDAGFDPAFNPTGNQPFTAMTWFRTYPADERLQTIMGQGNNWAINLNTTTAGGQIIWSLSDGVQVTSTNSLNDGQWHLVAGVYDGTNSYLYVDGVLNNSGIAIGGLIGEPTADLFLGGDADNTFELNAFGSGYFAGAVAQTAFYTNALSFNQINKIYDIATIPSISLSYSGGQVVINYTGTLLSSTNVAGPYTQVISASGSPYMVAPTRGAVFYRTIHP